MIKNVENIELCGSGYAFARIIELEVQISSYEPLGGSSYIKTPKEIEGKKKQL